MNAQPRPTYTLKPDLPDQLNGRPNVEAMQEEYLIERIGIEKYAAFCLREAHDARANKRDVEG
jgi:hypothetical protein